MATRKRSSFRNVTVNFKNAVVLDVKKLMAVAAEEIPKLIKKRVRRDTDAFDRPMQSLSPRTVDRLRTEGKPEDPILRGPMVNNVQAIASRAEGKGARLTFAATGTDERGRLWSAIGWFHQVGKGVPMRPWFGLSKRDRRKLANILKKAGALKSTAKPKVSKPRPTGPVEMPIAMMPGESRADALARLAALD